MLNNINLDINQSQSDTNISFANMRNTMEANRKVWFITGQCIWGDGCRRQIQHQSLTLLV